MKAQMLVYVDIKKKHEVEEIKKETGKSITELVEEGIESVIERYKNKPKTFEEALNRIAGLGKKYEIKNTRDELNKSFKRRLQRFGLNSSKRESL
ncbi:MAG: hypothetical protein ABH873_00295 [Candidatus Firestonebacteria bacterium]